MAIVRDEAIVLKRSLFRETSLIVTVFARRNGKVKLLFKGIRKQKNERLAACEPFTRVSIVYYEKLKSDLHLGSDTSILEAYGHLKQNLRRFGFASYLAELMDALFEPADVHEDVFEVLSESLRLMSLAEPEVLARIFEIKVFERIGWLPVLVRCVVCGKADFEKTYFSPAQGGIVCTRCDWKEPHTIPVSKETRETLVFFIQNPVSRGARLKVSSQTAHQLERISECYLAYHLNRRLKSQKFISDLQPLLKSA